MACEAPHGAQSSNHRCCAERRLLASWERQARQHGIPAHSITTWVRRKVGADVVVWRQLSDGSLGCATPCVLCHRVLVRYDLRVHCTLSGNTWFSGRMDAEDAPASKLTAGQRRLLGRPLKVPKVPGPATALKVP